GRGRLTVRATYHREEREHKGDRIVITELPYQENKSRLVEHVADLVNEGELAGVTDLRDESDRDGVRVVIETSRDANTDVIENQLLERVLERTFGVINLALVDGQPEVLDLKELLAHYVEHRKEVVTRRSAHELEEAEDRAHILEGRLHALDHIEDVVELIRNSADRDAARDGLQAEFDFTEPQAEHIVRMQLGSLTALEAEEIEAEHAELLERIERLETILDDEAELLGVIKDELAAIKAEYDDERRTAVVEDAGSVTREDLIPEEEVVVVVTEDDYVKRMPLSTFTPQGRGGKGIIGTELKEGDRVATVFRANTHDYLLCVTNHGQIYRLKVFEVPERGRTARGTSAVNILDLDEGEDIAAVVTTEDFEAGTYVAMATRQGYVKRTPVDAFENIRSTGIIATKLEDDDELVDVVMTDGTADLVMGTAGGRAIRFDEDEVRPMGRTARGVHGIRLEDGDAVAGMTAIEPEVHDHLLTVTRNGYGKRTPLEAYRPQSRNGKGLIDIKTPERNGPVCTLDTVCPGDHLLAMTDGGQIMRTRIDDISAVGRNTMGVVIMDVGEADRLSSVDVIPADVVEANAAEEPADAA
ncbi:MAG: DNA gyrase C-terminal beta-propeller domain-containing protein, partial [Halobacteriales archaeon]